MQFSNKTMQEVQRIINFYPEGKQKSALIPVLHLAQQEFGGWLSTETMDYVASVLNLSPIEVYEVATFYNMYNLEPVGAYKITVCTNLPCALSGSNDTAAYLKQKLGIRFNQTTPDGKFTLKEGECFGACGDAPVLLVNNKRMCSFMSNEMIDKLLKELDK